MSQPPGTERHLHRVQHGYPASGVPWPTPVDIPGRGESSDGGRAAPLRVGGSTVVDCGRDETRVVSSDALQGSRDRASQWISCGAPNLAPLHARQGLGRFRTSALRSRISSGGGGQSSGDGLPPMVRGSGVFWNMRASRPGSGRETPPTRTLTSACLGGILRFSPSQAKSKMLLAARRLDDACPRKPWEARRV